MQQALRALCSRPFLRPAAGPSCAVSRLFLQQALLAPASTSFCEQFTQLRGANTSRARILRRTACLPHVRGIDALLAPPAAKRPYLAWVPDEQEGLHTHQMRTLRSNTCAAQYITKTSRGAAYHSLATSVNALRVPIHKLIASVNAARSAYTTDTARCHIYTQARQPGVCGRTCFVRVCIITLARPAAGGGAVYVYGGFVPELQKCTGLASKLTFRHENSSGSCVFCRASTVTTTQSPYNGTAAVRGCQCCIKNASHRIAEQRQFVDVSAA